MSKNELKDKVIRVCDANYAFAPAKKNIILLEADDNGKYILFRVNNNGLIAEYKIEDFHIEQTLACIND